MNIHIEIETEREGERERERARKRERGRIFFDSESSLHGSADLLKLRTPRVWDAKRFGMPGLKGSGPRV